MNVLVTYYKRDGLDNRMYKDDKPITESVLLPLPLKFGFGSYNEPYKLMSGVGINVDDLKSIDREPLIHTP